MKSIYNKCWKKLLKIVKYIMIILHEFVLNFTVLECKNQKLKKEIFLIKQN